MGRKIALLYSVMALLASSACVRASQISWSGYTWNVTDSGSVRQEPGPNYFTTGNVAVDSWGRLHLKITQIGTKWYCGEIGLDHSLGYGTYRFYLEQGLNAVDPRVVLGMFTYESDTREIDIELSKWGATGPNDPNAQYVVQPYTNAGNLHQFLLGFDPGFPQQTHSFLWRWNSIVFQSVKYGWGQSSIVQSWVYAKPAGIPPAGNERAFVNLWLMDGQATSGWNGTELVLDRVEFVPQPAIAISIKTLLHDAVVVRLGDRNRYKLLGKVTRIDANNFYINDGSGVSVKVNAPSHGVATGNFVAAEGRWSPTPNPPTLYSSAGWVVKVK